MATSRTEGTEPDFAQPIGADPIGAEPIGFERETAARVAPLRMGPATATLVWLAACAGMWLLVSEIAVVL